MWWRLVSIVVLGGSLGACAPLASPQRAVEVPAAPAPSPEVFTHRVSTTHVVLSWNCTPPESGQLRLEGLAYSPYFSDVRVVAIRLVGVDGRERVVSEVWGELRDPVLGLSRPFPFQLTLRTTGTEARFDIYYGYAAQGGLRSRLTGLAVVGATRLAQSQSWFMARDVCSDTPHGYPRPIG